MKPVSQVTWFFFSSYVKILGANPEKLAWLGSSRVGVCKERKKENLEILKTKDQYTKQKQKKT